MYGFFSNIGLSSQPSSLKRWNGYKYSHRYSRDTINQAIKHIIPVERYVRFRLIHRENLYK